MYWIHELPEMYFIDGFIVEDDIIGFYDYEEEIVQKISRTDDEIWERVNSIIKGQSWRKSLKAPPPYIIEREVDNGET